MKHKLPTSKEFNELYAKWCARKNVPKTVGKWKRHGKRK